jgi:hypothetical protein
MHKTPGAINLRKEYQFILNIVTVHSKTNLQSWFLAGGNVTKPKKLICIAKINITKLHINLGQN